MARVMTTTVKYWLPVLTACTLYLRLRHHVRLHSLLPVLLLAFVVSLPVAAPRPKLVTMGCGPKWTYFNGYCYFYSYDSDYVPMATFTDARRECRRARSFLASVHSSAENEFLYAFTGLYPGVQNIWLGLRHSSRTGGDHLGQWIDGSLVGFRHWAAHPRPEGSPATLCVQLKMYQHGDWSLADCRSRSFYVCKKKPHPQKKWYPDFDCNDCPYYRRRRNEESNSILPPDFPLTPLNVTPTTLPHLVLPTPLSISPLPSHSTPSTPALSEPFEYSNDSAHEPPDPSMKLQATLPKPVSRRNLDDQILPSGGEETHSSVEVVEVGQFLGGRASWGEDTAMNSSQRLSRHTRSEDNFVCLQKPSVACYRVPDLQLNWRDAQLFCRLIHGGHLAAITSSEEMEALGTNLTMSGLRPGVPDTLWIGLQGRSEKNTFAWANGEAFNYTNWGTGEPSNNGLCAVAVFGSSQHWEVKPCKSVRHFICEIYPATVTTTTAGDPDDPAPTSTAATTTIPSTGNQRILPWHRTIPPYIATRAYSSSDIPDTASNSTIPSNTRSSTTTLTTPIASRTTVSTSTSTLASTLNSTTVAPNYRTVLVPPVTKGPRTTPGTTTTPTTITTPNATPTTITTTTPTTTITMPTTTTSSTTTMTASPTITMTTTTTTSSTTTKALTCRSMWTLFNEFCYKVFTEPVTWESGEKNCVSYGGHLASIANAAEREFLQRFDRSKMYSTSHVTFWVGLFKLHDEKGYAWTDGTEVGTLWWEINEPDSHYGRERCGSALRYNVKLTDEVCESFHPYICKAPVEASTRPQTQVVTRAPYPLCSDEDGSWLLHDNFCFKTFTGAAWTDGGRSWHGASRACQDRGAHLASVHTFQENYWILDLVHLMPDTMVWLGARADYHGSFTWSDGTPFDFVNWKQGEPNNDRDQEDCAGILSFHAGFWNDVNCGSKLGWVCKRPYGATHPPPTVPPPPVGNCQPGWTRLGTTCYMYSGRDRASNFDNARIKCRDLAHRADLVSVHSRQVNEFLLTLVDDGAPTVYIGMVKREEFVWADQTVVDFTSWGFEEPNGRNEGEQMTSYFQSVNRHNCVLLHVTPDPGEWDDSECRLSRPFVCQVAVDQHIETPAPRPMCPAPLNKYFRFRRRCFFLHMQALDWHSALSMCHGEGGQLAVIKDVRDNAFVWALLQETRRETEPELFQSVWIGLNSIRTPYQYVWSDGNLPEYTHWARWQPNAWIVTNRCVTFNASDGHWASRECDKPRPFMCVATPADALAEPVITTPAPDLGTCPDPRWLDMGGGYCYLISTEGQTWSKANFQCMQEQSSLVSIHSATELKRLGQTLEYLEDDIWTGLIWGKEGYSWSDGTAVNFFGATLEGQTEGDHLDCVSMETKTGKWKAQDCLKVWPYICKVRKSRHLPHYISNMRMCSADVGVVLGALVAGLAVGVVGGLVFCFLKKRVPFNIERTSFSVDNALYSAFQGAEHMLVSLPDLSREGDSAPFPNKLEQV